MKSYISAHRMITERRRRMKEWPAGLGDVVRCACGEVVREPSVAWSTGAFRFPSVSRSSLVPSRTSRASTLLPWRNGWPGSVPPVTEADAECVLLVVGGVGCWRVPLRMRGPHAELSLPPSLLGAHRDPKAPKQKHGEILVRFFSQIPKLAGCAIFSSAVILMRNPIGSKKEEKEGEGNCHMQVCS